MAALRVIANPQDEIAWMRYLQLWEGIGEITATKYIEEILSKESIDDGIEILKSKRTKNTKVTETLEAIKNLNNNPSRAIKVALENMQTRLAELYPADWNSKRKDDFSVLARMSEASPTINEFISEFILDPSLNESYLDKAEIKDIVTLSTIHSAKGLEADTCYVINVSPGAYPTKPSMLEGKEEVEEERRCLYVALTRAKNNLVITRNLASIQSYGTVANTSTTDEDLNIYFLDELPADLVENKTNTITSYSSSNDYTGESSDYDPFFNFG